jgi:hypothetical protein
MSKSREEIQNGYWSGGEIEDHRFHHLNLERKSLLQGVWAKLEGAGESPTEADQQLVAMAIYNMTNEEAAAAEPDFDFLRARATERGLGEMSLGAGAEFSAGFARDIAAMTASATKLAGDEE